MNLYKIEIQTYKAKPYYVCAPDVGTAYEAVRRMLDEKDHFFYRERELEKASFIAEEDQLLIVPEALEEK